MTSHDSVCILNANDEDALVELFLYFTDREPTGPYTIHVSARRACHRRFNDLSQPESMPIGVDIAVSSVATNRSSYSTPALSLANQPTL